MNTHEERAFLDALRDGGALEAFCREHGLAEAEAHAWLDDWHRRSLPAYDGELRARIGAQVTITRDARGVPHIRAESARDLFTGVGIAMAQDRLWQMHVMRRHARGTLAEVLGPRALEEDVTHRLVGIRGIAERDMSRLSRDGLQALVAFSAGVNAVIDGLDGSLPPEFELYEDEPEPWEPVDSMAIARAISWQLTGRLPVLTAPELARRILGETPLYRAFLAPEGGDEVIVPKGSYPTRSDGGLDPVGEVASGTESAGGSNNWVIAPERSATGAPLMATDPHLPLQVPSVCYEMRWLGGEYDAAGHAYVGFPNLWMGRNRRLAWSITNNICLQRDLYEEQVHPDDPTRYYEGDDFRPMRCRTEVIHVRGAAPVALERCSTTRGPVVNRILPEPLRSGNPISLRWMGAEAGDEPGCILELCRAGSVAAAREALRGWMCPTFNFLLADTDGHIGYQCVGGIPVRGRPERGIRRGPDPSDRWLGLIPYDKLPAATDPERGWLASANNRVVADDYAYPMSGTWTNDHRARRIREMIEAGGALDVEACRKMLVDVRSLRAADTCPGLLGLLGEPESERAREAVGRLRAWDFNYEGDSVAATIFQTWFWKWELAIVQARFPEALLDELRNHVSGLASSLVRADPAGWFSDDNARREAVHHAFEAALAWLTERLGPEISSWRWDRLHQVTIVHASAPPGLLAERWRLGPEPFRGTYVTVQAAHSLSVEPFGCTIGAGHRLVMDLASPDGLWSISPTGNAGHPGDANYGAEFPAWRRGELQRVPLNDEALEAEATATTRVLPGEET